MLRHVSNQVEFCMRVLCLFVHYFDSDGTFGGKSKYQDPNIRADIVSLCLFALNSIKFIETRVCGYAKKTLLPLDVDFSNATNNPEFMVYEALSSVARNDENYDYYMVIEDDILISPEIFSNIISFDNEFDEKQGGKWIYHPNRIEVNKNNIECIDLKVIKRTLGVPIKFGNRLLCQYQNPHSGIFIVNNRKIDIVRKEVDLSFRGRVIGGPMASAFAHFHKPFSLYRVSDGLDIHTVRHLDPMHYEPLTFQQRIARRFDRLLSK
jgi:hypothetical protein